MSKTQLWTYGHRKLGYGDYDGVTPYFRWTTREAGKLAAVMKRRKITPAEFVMCVDFCAAEHKVIADPVEVFAHLGEARDWAKGRTSEQHASDLARQIAEAIDTEQRSAAPDQVWIGRLARARGSFRADVLAEWQAAKAAEA